MLIDTIIPCRSGSKGLPNKNIKLYKNKPLIAYSIELSKKCEYINNTYVSTDSKYYSEIAQKYGAIIPYLRPSEISQDLSTDYEFLIYHINWLIETNKVLPDYILQLRPTYPNRSLDILNDCINIIKNNQNYDSLRTVVSFDKSPYKMYTIENNNLNPLFNIYNNINEPYNCARQLLPQCYLHNGYIDIIKTNTILNLKSTSGNKIYPYIMNSNNIDDIDTIDDWNKSEKKY